MKRIQLIFGCHSHQPVGNFDFVFREAFEKSYRPFIDVLERFPAVKCVLHYTGPLFDWFEVYEPEYLERLAAMARQGQVEIMGGAYYEPLLCAIPQRDAVGQIHRMQDYCEQRFGQRPRGMWLTERVWEPQMAKTLAMAGVGYTALDDAHFMASGVRREDCFGYYVTEDEGQTVRLFPILERLRYTIPFHSVQDSIDFLRAHATEDGRRVAVIHDDGEKFGVWPGTYGSVYEEGWLEAFFQAVTDNREWLHSTTYAEYLDGGAEPLGRTYITCASYMEMNTWVLPTPMQRNLHAIHHELEHDHDRHERYKAFLRGGFWRGFLAKYPESNTMQKRMLRVSDRLDSMRAAYGTDSRFDEAVRLLYESQCNCAYWHGAFGGLYLNHLRTAIYDRCLRAEQVLDAIEGKSETWSAVTTGDFDCDGTDEVLLENETMALLVAPKDGGTVVEIDYKRKAFNVGNTLTRREEPYHDALRDGAVSAGDGHGEGKSIHDIVHAKEDHLDRFLVYDPYRRVSLRNHVLPGGLAVSTFAAGTLPDWGTFDRAAYTAETRSESVAMRCEGPVGPEVQGWLRVEKRVSLAAGDDSAAIACALHYRGDAVLHGMFAMEFAFNCLTGSAPDRYLHSDSRDLGRPVAGETGLIEGVEHIALRDEWMGIEAGIRAEGPILVYHFPIETVSQSEGGQERVYQGTVLVPCWPLALEPDQERRIAFRMEVRDLS